MNTRTDPRGVTGWQFAILIALAVLLAAFAALGCTQAFVAASNAADDPTLIFQTVCSAVTAAFGALVLARGRDNRAAAFLGIVLIGFSTMAAPLPQSDLFNIPRVALSWSSAIVRGMCIGWLWPLFSLAISGGPASRRQDRIVHALAAFTALLPLVALGISYEQDTRLSGIVGLVWFVMVVSNQVLGYWILLRNYRRNDAAGRNRIKIALVAFVLFMIASLTNVVQLYAGMPELTAVTPAFALGATVLLAYATLRHRLFDFGFALNRTLVYAVLSFILLLAFGLAEWAIEHLVPEAWHDGGPLISVAIALALFLSFHRLRDWVERHIERLLFSGWHRNEATLRKFIGSATHFEQTRALTRAFAEELTRFAQGAGAAIYLRTADGGYHQQAGNLAGARKAYAADDRAFALMRAEREPVDVARAHSALPAALALPMLDQGVLAGFALLGSKPDGIGYRPDEVEVLGWAAQQIGFAVQARHARELEDKLVGLSATVATLSEERDRLSALLAGSPVRRARVA